MFRSKKEKHSHISNQEMDYDDEDLFSVSSHSSGKLAAIFSDDSKSSSSRDLKYIPPKQPNKEENKKPENSVQSGKNDKAEANSEILYVTSGDFFLQENNSPNFKGPVMCAIIRKTQNTFVVLIYKTKQNILSQIGINLNSSFTVEKNNYLIYSEGPRIMWWLHLEAQKFQELLTQIGICRTISAYTDPSPPSFVKQSLSEGIKNKAVKLGDAPIVSFYSWKIENYKKGRKLDEMKLHVKLKTNTNTWESKLIDCHERQLCLIFTRSEDRPTEFIAYEVTIESVSDADSSSQNNQKQSSQTVHDVLPEMNQEIKEDDSCIKASLISRMAKVGQPLLPTAPKRNLSRAAAPTDSESEADDQALGKSLRQTPRHGQSHLRSSTSSSMEEINVSTRRDGRIGDSQPENISHLVPSVGNVPPFVHPHYGSTGLGAVVAYQPFLANPTHQEELKSKSSEPLLSLLFSETRSQNTELRVALSQLTQKIDTVCDKMNNLETQSLHGQSVTSRSVIPSSVSQYEPRELLDRITSMVQQIDSFKSKEKTNEQKIEELTLNYTQLLKKNQSLLEEKAELVSLKGESQESKNQSRIHIQELLSIQEEKIKIQTEREQLLVENAKLKNDIEKHCEDISGLRKNLETSELKHSEQTEILNKTNEENKKLMKRMEDKEKEILQLEGFRGETDKLRKTIEELEKENERLGGKLSNLENEKFELGARDDQTRRELEFRLKDLEQQVRKTEDDSKSDKTLIDELRQEVQNYKKKLQELDRENQQKILSLSNKVEELKNVERRVNSDGGADIEALIKRIMNAAYKKLKTGFKDSEIYDKSTVLEMVLASIRDTTLQYLENYKNPKKNDGDTNKAEKEANIREMNNTFIDDNREENVEITRVRENEVGLEESKSNNSDNTESREERDALKRANSADVAVEKSEINTAATKRPEEKKNRDEEDSNALLNQTIPSSNINKPSAPPAREATVPSVKEESVLNTKNHEKFPESKMSLSGNKELSKNVGQDDSKSTSDGDSGQSAQNPSVLEAVVQGPCPSHIDQNVNPVENLPVKNSPPPVRSKTDVKKEEEDWRPVPPPPPLFSDNEDDDDFW